MAISKIDDFEIKLAKIKDKNPINSIEATVDIIFKDDAITDIDQNGALRIKEDDLI
jgi:hypothetical protein